MAQGYNPTWTPQQKANWYASSIAGAREVQTVAFETKYMPTVGGKPVMGVDGEDLMPTRGEAVDVARRFKAHMATKFQ